MNANQSSVKGNHGRSSFVGFFSAFSALGALLCALPGFTLDNAAGSAGVVFFVALGVFLLPLKRSPGDAVLDSPLRILWSPRTTPEAYATATFWWFGVVLVLLYAAASRA